MADLLGLGAGLIKGLFSGNARLGDTFLPNNDLLTEYGITDSNNLFSVNLQAFKPPVISVKKTKGGSEVNPESTPTPLKTFDVLYSGQNLKIDHNHKFDTSQLGSIVNKFFNEEVAFGFKGKDIAAQFAEAAKLFKEGDQNIEAKLDWNTFSSVDVAKAYKGSTPPSITINFTLLASKDPLREVVLPCLALTYLSYPRLSDDSLLSTIVSLATAAGDGAASIFGQAGLGNLGAGDDKTKKDAEELEKLATGKLKEIYTKLKSSYEGRWRAQTGYPPPFWQVTCSNGLFSMKNASLSNLSINYNGPWLAAPPPANILSTLAKFADGTSVGFPVSEVFPGSSIGSIASDILGLFSAKGDGTFKGMPTYAEVTMTFENNFTQLYAEDWINFDSKVKGSEKG